MPRVPGIEIVRRAYKIWEMAGKPDGKDQEFYFQAERELEEELKRDGPTTDLQDDAVPRKE
jgi:ribonuclease I